jgi:hypothetical protein
MNGHEVVGCERLDEHSRVVREALERYASARAAEDGLELSRDAIFRQLAAARDETFAAWRQLNAALVDAAESEEEGEP